MRKLLNATEKAGKSHKSKSSNSMEVDNSSEEISPSVERWFSLPSFIFICFPAILFYTTFHM